MAKSSPTKWKRLHNGENSTKQRPDQPFRFLKLPPEVRNMIYACLLPSRPITIAAGKYNFGPTPTRKTNPRALSTGGSNKPKNRPATLYMDNHPHRTTSRRGKQPRYKPVMLFLCRQTNREFGAMFFEDTAVSVHWPVDFAMALDFEVNKKERKGTKNLPSQYRERRLRYQHTAAAVSRFRRINIQPNFRKLCHNASCRAFSRLRLHEFLQNAKTAGLRRGERRPLMVAIRLPALCDYDTMYCNEIADEHYVDFLKQVVRVSRDADVHVCLDLGRCFKKRGWKTERVVKFPEACKWLMANFGAEVRTF